MGHHFCREFLKQVLKEIKCHVDKKEIEAAWAWKTSAGYEFHGPEKFYVFLGTKADCKWSAKAVGWERFLRGRGINKTYEFSI